jgi:peptide-methionine (S)-S-oxide reductase
MTDAPKNSAAQGRFFPALSTVFTAAALLAIGVGFTVLRSGAAEEAHMIPAPAVDAAAAEGATSEVAIIAGGCFWGVQGVFQHVKGVTKAVSGYAGGDEKTAHYQIVGSGETGHAEAVRITFDPRQISYGRLLQIYFAVAHDPTQLDRQGPDYGTQYRSAIFPTNSAQARIAQDYIAQLDQAHAYHAKIVTKIEPGRPFYPAEDYHQDFMTRNPGHPYIVYHDIPKVDDLKRLFADRYRDEPVLVAGTPLN